ncbi:hypothetical protein ATE67_19415 [Sphingopyxis sp. H050]|uniref:hypothetical protein n=1 Tax=unclassified Sphingopyxis TaxID=2614943 RepID=UPI0007371A8C|nr:MULTISPECIES: hypothetical protein [unclassified Sphingopyxis]KTE05786.1 hypothetical protein ATE76_20370 [Sphingopyxis sp. H093]KTE12085.1 hypothetical protein ATE71_10945 [Sphingopyxis sp. H115]KTE18136.1 hypothetical protein ATE67_19415 [Sphingopyxis sp. H050]KTE63801.1 hypothetical protein ATE74_18675 [Sphingopyxis sp. H085]
MPFAEQPPVPPVLEAPSLDLERVDRAAERIDLKTIRPRCPEGRGNEIVVCAPDPEEHRARRLPDTYAVTEGLPRAEIDVGNGVSLDVHLDSGSLANGYTANRVMVGVKFKF